MKEGPPTAVLSQRLREMLSGRRIDAGVFMTFTLEPEFFEQEVVSLLAGDELNQEPKLRLLQLQEKLRGSIGPLTVYYDRAGLRPDSAARLDIRYIPAYVRSGLFHPKTILLLTTPLDENSKDSPALLCGVLSSNLTKDGWWSSIECAHFEWVAMGDRCSFHGDLRRLLRDVRKLGGRESDHLALDRIYDWIKRNSTQAQHATGSGMFRTRLVAGTQSFLDFLLHARGHALSGCSLEVISPFFDERTSAPLANLIESLAIRETRVFLPQAPDGSALFTSELFDAVRDLNNTTWASLPSDFLRLGKDANAKPRSVHAKLYRFLKRSARLEALVVGSHNLTTSAHQQGGNFEASFFLERAEPQLDWWLQPRSRRPGAFKPELAGDEDSIDLTQFIPLQLCYDWASDTGQVRWDGESASPFLQIVAGTPLFELHKLPSGKWVDLDDTPAAQLRKVLESTSLVAVKHSDGRTGTVLVQESGMSRKPDIVVSFTITDILEYWSRLTDEQKATYLQAHFAGGIPEDWGQADGVQRVTQRQAGFFETFAGIFHGFEMLRKQVKDSLTANRPQYADYLLLGAKYDSLPRVLDKAFAGEDESDPVTRYLLILCARQVLNEIRRDPHPFFKERRPEIDRLLQRTRDVESLTSQLALGGNGKTFIRWLEGHFVKRLEPLPELVDV